MNRAGPGARTDEDGWPRRRIRGGGLLLIDVLDLTVYGVVTPVAALLLMLVMARIGSPDPSIAWMRIRVDRTELLVIAAIYVVTRGAVPARL